MLLETLVSISLIVVVMAAVSTFFVNAVASTSQQRATQVATQIANSTVEEIRAIPTSDLVSGHDPASVTTQFKAASGTVVAPWLAAMVAATDPTAPVGNGATAGVPTVAVKQTVNNVVYSVNTYFGTCVIAAGVTLQASCALSAVSSGIGYLRAVVAVTWSGSRCPTTGCTFVTSTLLSPIDDPLFNVNQSPPAPPVLVYPTALVWAVGDSVVLKPTNYPLQAVPTFRVNISSGTLPAGVTLDTATGLISGTPLLVAPSTSLTLMLTDGFGRATTATFSWTVLAGLATTAPAAQASFIGTALSLTLPAATGGTPGYTWSDPGTTLPPGLALSMVNGLATITGTPTAKGLYPVTLTVTDSMNRTSTVGFPWTTDYPPLVAGNPGPQTSTVGTVDSVTLNVTGGSGSFAWSGDATLPAGLTLSSNGIVSGTPTGAGATSVALLVADTKAGTKQNVAFSWTVYDRPTVTSPAKQSWTVGAAVTLQLATNCPNAPCRYAMNNGPATFGISSGGVLAGTVTSAAQTFNTVTVTVTDSSAATATTPGFTVAVSSAPRVASPGDQTVAPGAPVSVNVAGLAAGGTAPLTYSAVNLPSWVKFDPSTGLITGTAPNTASTTTGTSLTVTDALGVSASSPTFNWIVAGPPSAPLTVMVVAGDSAVTPSWTAPTTGPVTSYTATLGPGGASCTTTGLSCDIGKLTNGAVYSLTVTATNSVGTGPASTAVTAIPYPALMSARNGMSLWLDGADPSVLLGDSDCKEPSTTSLACWKDKSGHGENFVQATESKQPGVATWNGLPAANFADPGDVLTSINDTGNYQTVFVAANITNAADEKLIVDLFGQADKNFNVRVGTGAPRNSPNGSDWSFKTEGPLNWANGAQGAMVNQPVAVITTDQASSPRSFTASISNSFEKRGLIGQVGEVITFGSVLDTDQRRSVEQYLTNKWGVHNSLAPTEVTARASEKGDVTVAWTAPKTDGENKITGYTVTPQPEGKGCTTSGELSCTVTGLSRKTTYTFTVTATDSAGVVGPASAASNPVTTR